MCDFLLLSVIINVAKRWTAVDEPAIPRCSIPRMRGIVGLEQHHQY